MKTLTKQPKKDLALKEVLKKVDELEAFLDCDMDSKIFPTEIINGEKWTRYDYFKDRKEVREYLELHFKIFREELKK